jgi:uncharacterized Zn finger protein
VGPLVAILHREAIRRLVDDRTFERGQAYVAQGRVVDLVRQDRGLAATVKGTSDYQVSIRAKGEALAYSCSCPVGTEGGFCKHSVAVVLAYMGEVAPEIVPAPQRVLEPPPRAALDPLVARLQAQPREVLLRILLDEVATDVELFERVTRRLPIT